MALIVMFLKPDWGGDGGWGSNNSYAMPILILLKITEINDSLSYYMLQSRITLLYEIYKENF